jgi:hypothetical protein
MKTEDPLSEADEQSSEAFRNFPYDQVDAHLAASPVPPWREAQLARMRKTQIHPPGPPKQGLQLEVGRVPMTRLVP